MPSLLSTMLKMEERLAKVEDMEERLMKMENMEKRMMKMKDMEERMAKMENSMEARIEEEVVKRVNEIRRKMDEDACLKANETEGKINRLEAKFAVRLEEVKVECSTRAKEAKKEVATKIKKELTTAKLQDWDYDPAEQRYCICNQVVKRTTLLIFVELFSNLFENLSATRWLTRTWFSARGTTALILAGSTLGA